MQRSAEITLPDLFSLTPFTWDGCNPFFSRDDKHSTEWVLSYSVFADRMRARLAVSCIEILGANTYPYADAKGLSVASDYIMLVTSVDEITDVQDPQGAENTRDLFMKAYTGTCDSGDDDSQVAMLAKDFRATLPSMSNDVWERLVTHTKLFLDGTVDEAQLRKDNEIPPFDKYLQIRRKSGVCPALFDFIEILLGITLPAEVFEEPNFLKIYGAMNDMICITNDIYSFPIEFERGLEGANIVGVLMHHKNLFAQRAMEESAALYKQLADIVESHKEKIRSFGPENDAAIRLYIYGMEQWVCGHIAWYLDTKRYFGDAIEEVKRTGKVQLSRRAA